MSEILDKLVVGAYIAPFVFIFGLVVHRRRRQQIVAAETLDESIETGLMQPASLHPVVDPLRCIGSGGCVSACPEGNVIGMIGGKAELVEPSRCIGHGACAAACPHQAISLVIGTAERGVELPVVTPDFQSKVDGIYIAGELGGMGLVKNAITQGTLAMQAIGAREDIQNARRNDPLLDVVIVGAGPAGIAAALTAKEKNLKHVIIEQSSFGGTVANFPRRKMVMTAPVHLSLVGNVRFGEVRKEELVDFWNELHAEHEFPLHTGFRVEKIEPLEQGFRVKAGDTHFDTRCVLLAIGRRGTPRRLDVPGEDLSKVSYSLVDPAQYQNQAVVVVGGGDSAIEAAISIAEEPGTDVTLSYRSDAFSRAKKKNRDRLIELEAAGTLRVMLRSQLREIADKEVVVELEGAEQRLRNDAVIIAAGGILPTAFLKDIGIAIETHHGERAIG
ncbi:NAD(P)-binding domain-containing protein [Congregibacter sp.]|uniref:NAD(P)-binding domain-containing protein n=1 Tax=Congregibacter sp. TaxID=2744308 RepID=UPI003F6B4706